jgi:hypothetical protein
MRCTITREDDLDEERPSITAEGAAVMSALHQAPSHDPKMLKSRSPVYRLHSARNLSIILAKANETWLFIRARIKGVA